MELENKRYNYNRERSFKKELSLWNPLYLQFHFLINDIKKYLEKIDHNSVIIDIGCGTKPYQKFVHKSIKYIGVDIDSKNENVDIVSSAYKINLPQSHADYIVSFQVLEHLEEPLLMLKESYRLLKPGGELCLTFPMSEQLHEEPFDFYRYTEHGIKYLLEKSEFKKIQIVRQGTNYANIGRRLVQMFYTRWYLKIFVPVINYFFRRIENRKGQDVMNYMVIAEK